MKPFYKYCNNLGLFSLLLFSIACGKDADTLCVYLDNAVKTDAKDIVPTRIIDGDMFPFALDFYVHKDSTLIVFNRAASSTVTSSIPFLEFRKLSDTTLCKQVLRRGNGPDEVLDILCQYVDSCLYLVDFIKNRFAIVDVNDILEDRNEKSVDFKERSFRFGDFKRYDNNAYIFDNYNCFSDESLGIYQKANRFIISDGMKGDTLSYEYNAFNANQGKVMVNPLRDRVLYFNSDRPEIEIYDYDLNLIKKVVGPDESEARYGITNGNGIAYYGKVPYYYCNYTYDNDRVFISYNGVVLRDGMRRIPGLIFEFDWDGNFIASYNPHEPVVRLSISNNDKNILYITSTDSLGQSVLDILKI